MDFMNEMVQLSDYIRIYIFFKGVLSLGYYIIGCPTLLQRKIYKFVQEYLEIIAYKIYIFLWREGRAC